MADAVQYQKDQDARQFAKGKIAAARQKVQTRVNRADREATTEEQALLEAYKTAAIALGKYVAKNGIQPLSLSGAMIIPVVDTTMVTDRVVGNREEQLASSEAFKAKVKSDLEAIAAVEDGLDVAFFTQQGGAETAKAVSEALEKLAAL